MGARICVPDFALANPLYAAATVSFYTVDNDGVKTATLATLYEAPTGSGTLLNPQTLDSEGKNVAPIYIEDPVIAAVTGLTNVDDHDTGVIWAPGTWRGDWATAMVYYPGDFFRAAASADASNDLYLVNEQHTSGTFATDIGNSLASKVLDVSVIADLFDAPDPSGHPLEFLRVNSGATAYEFLTAVQVWAALTKTTTRGDIIKRGASADERLPIGAANRVLTSNGTDPAWAQVVVAMLANAAKPYDVGFAAGYDADMVKEDLAVKTYGKVDVGRAFTATGEVSSVETAPTDAALIVDVEKNGTSIYTTKPQYAASGTTLTAGVLKSDGTQIFAAGDTLTFKVTQIGSTEPGEGLTFTLLGVLA